MGILDKVKNLVAKNADKVDTAIDKVGDAVDKKTQGKYAQHVNKVQDAAKKAVDGTQTGPQSHPGPVPPTQQSGQPPASPPAPPPPPAPSSPPAPPQAPTPPQS